jgi:predicted O-linked N-acetylglucosamine transferase (SPINDLY family)
MELISSQLEDGNALPVKQMRKVKAKLDQKAYSQALSVAGALLRTYPDSPFLWISAGLSQFNLRNWSDARNCLETALKKSPDSTEALRLLSQTLVKSGFYDEAVATTLKLLKLDPGRLDPLRELAISLLEEDQKTTALKCFHILCEADPSDIKTVCTTARLSYEINDNKTALKLFEFAEANGMEDADSFFTLGWLHYDDDNIVAALRALDRSIKADPTRSDAEMLKLHYKARICDWTLFDTYRSRRAQIGMSGNGAPPWGMMSLEDDPDLLFQRTRKFASARYPLPDNPIAARRIPDGAKIRVGLFSSDFFEHATMELLGGFFEAYDRDCLELYAYSSNGRPADGATERVKRNVTCFREVSDMPSGDLVELARGDNLDIAIDLKGFTKNTRSEAIARRVAPVQIAYLGFPGSMAHPAYDYMIADNVVIPAEFRSSYSEKMIMMPDSYQINDNKRKVSDHIFTRAECGLPEDAFVFCSFNNSYKISPREFDIWMRLLQKVKGSVLWLLDPERKGSVENLKREAAARGIDSSRLIFAPRKEFSDHLARHRCADLFLDTFNVNAHTTASDALWAGLPIVTKAGKQFAARVSASLLHACDLEQLVTGTEAQYEELALDLAMNPEKLHKVRSRLQENRDNLRLFDTQRFTRHLETALKLAVQRAQDGLPPADLEVPALEN